MREAFISSTLPITIVYLEWMYDDTFSSELVTRSRDIIKIIWRVSMISKNLIWTAKQYLYINPSIIYKFVETKYDLFFTWVITKLENFDLHANLLLKNVFSVKDNK